MNTVHARRWLEAAAACDPEGFYAGPLALVAALAPVPCFWEGAVSGGSPFALRLLPSPDAALPEERAAAAAAVLGLSALPARLDASWDARAALWSARKAPGGAARPFNAAAFPEPVGSALARFHALCPVASARASGAEWTLALARPLAWPLFLRCDLSAAFQPRASQLSLLLRDARVTALDFDGEALWARFF